MRAGRGRADGWDREEGAEAAQGHVTVSWSPSRKHVGKYDRILLR